MNVDDISQSSQEEQDWDNTAQENPAHSLGDSQEDGFHAQALRVFGSVMRRFAGQTPRAWAEQMLQQVTPFLKGVQASLYCTNTSKQTLEFLAGFALDFQEKVKQSYAFGEGLIGQVAKDQETITLSDHQDFVSIASVHKIRIKCIIIKPLLYNKQTVGVLEINFPQIPPREFIDFLHTIGDGMASQLYGQLHSFLLSKEYEELRIRENRLNRMSQAATEGIILLDEHRTILEVSDTARNILGYSSEELMGRPVFDFLKNDSSGLDLSQDMQPNSPLEVEVLRKDGHLSHLEILERVDNKSGTTQKILSLRNLSRHNVAQASSSAETRDVREEERNQQLAQLLRQRNRNLATQVNYVQRIQKVFLPSDELIKKQLSEHLVFQQSRDAVGGDAYWFTYQDNRTILATYDCTGRGVSGAMLSLATAHFLQEIVNFKHIINPDEVLTQLHKKFQAHINTTEGSELDGLDITLCTLDKVRQELSFAGAHQNLILIQGGELKEFRGNRQNIGGVNPSDEVNRIFTQTRIPLLRGEKNYFYMFSNGIPDQFGGESGQKFTKKRLLDLLLKIHKHPMKEQKRIIYDMVQTWMKDQKQVDDMILIGFVV